MRTRNRAHTLTLSVASMAAALSLTLGIPNAGAAPDPDPAITTTSAQSAPETGQTAPPSSNSSSSGSAAPTSDAPSSTATAPTSSEPSTSAPSTSTTPSTDAPPKSTTTSPKPQARAAVAAGCQTYPPTSYQVCGRIRDKYNQTGGPNGFLLFPKTNELTNPNNTGKRSEFLGGNIYWSTATDAHPVAHDFLTKWGQYGYEGGFLKYPTTDEIPLGIGVDGRRQEFQGGYLYFDFPTGTHNVQGAILDKYKAIGGPGSYLGFPKTDETGTPDGKGRYNTFEYGSLYWSAASGAHPVYGEILNKWGDSGYERGTYGYPTGDPVWASDGGVTQAFQRGTITASAPNGGNPPFRRGVDKEPGPNFDEAQECLQGYDPGPLTYFHNTGETLMCKDFRYIYGKHFPNPATKVLNYVNWVDFETCVAYTLMSSEKGFSPNENQMYGRTRYNSSSGTRSFAIVRDSDNPDNPPGIPFTIYNAFTSGDGGRDWGGCREGLQ